MSEVEPGPEASLVATAQGPAPASASVPPSAPVVSFRVMDVEDVVLDLPSQYPAVTLVESEPPMRTLVFPVGLPEGTAIAQAMRRMEGRRPMTHELFMQVLQRARIDVIAVRLVGREEGTLLAELDVMTPGVASGWTVALPTGSCWHCVCRCRRRSWSTSGCSRAWATSTRWTGPDPTRELRRAAGSDQIGP